ncbi:hypothetical protein CBR_g6676 [Chara braunii]|uniref:Myb-like domain-containing protein n=1 Tax=Chara braunii TaxID=69332 RepID=A0A388KKG5_CHABU|nr:hypothetical protein CBR_g6676 [Chara braunii]|eukprot:GBG70550.1 hypothetical protein CBR_g6676 [Chara braunii]
MHVVHHLRCRAVPWALVSRHLHGLAGGRYVADAQPLWGRGQCVGVPLHNSISSIRRTLSLHAPSPGAVEVRSVVRAVRPNITSVVGRKFVPEGNNISHAIQRCGGIGRIVEGGLTDRDVAVAARVYARPYVAHPPRLTAAQDGVLGGGRACPCRCLRDSTGTTVIIIDVDNRERGLVGSHMFLWGLFVIVSVFVVFAVVVLLCLGAVVVAFLATRRASAGGQKRKGGSSPRPWKKNSPWSLEERLELAKFAGEDDALTADAEGSQACMTRSKRWEWVAGRLGEIGYSRSAEDCRKKWAEMVKKVREIRDACEGSGKQVYWDTTTEQWRKLGLSLTFERQLWDTMEWYRLKKSVTCDNTLASEDLRGGGSPSGGEAGSEGAETNASDTTTKTRRTSSGKARRGDSPASMYSMTSVMEESTRALCEGLERAANTLARVSTDGSRMVATEIEAVVGAMRQGNAVLEMLVGVMAERGAGSGRGVGGSRDTDPSTT